MFETTYTKHEDTKQIVVERVFAAKRDRVWNAFTDNKILEKWFAPKPWTAGTETFEFSEGGHWHYYMQSPEGQKHWGMTTYQQIQPQDFFTAHDGFCDESGVINPDMPQMNWHTAFADAGENTKVIVTLTFETLEALHATVKMGFEQGYAMSHKNLDELLAQ